MRIISGSCKGKKLAPIEGKAIRPTSDRAREALFNIIGRKTEGAVVLDLFAGTGALGLEALSRGAARAFFIDVSPESCAVIKKNIQLCRFQERGVVCCHDLSNQGIPGELERETLDLIFMDPPYGSDLLTGTLADPGLVQRMKSDAIIIAERSVKEKNPGEISGLDIKDQRKYSKSLITFYEKKKQIL